MNLMFCSVVLAIVLLASQTEAGFSDYLGPLRSVVFSDCEYSVWTPWSECSAPCNFPGFRSRSRDIVHEASYGGNICDRALLEEWEDCQDECAPIRDCQVTPWANWGVCRPNNGLCGPGKRDRTRQVVTFNQVGGAPCGSLEEWDVCDAGQCAVNCEMSRWSQWTRCSADCGEGQRSRTRSIITPPSFSGLQCGETEEWEACTYGECQQDCVMDEWSQWTRCSADCGEGQRSRSRGIRVNPSPSGRQCGRTHESEACSYGDCQRNCQMSRWSSWTRCSADCGTGKRSRTRTIIERPTGNGQQCGSLEEWEDCSNGQCSRNCLMSLWTAWTRCSADCGQGSRSRTRTIVEQPTGNGQKCGDLEEWEPCNRGSCARDCKMSFWTQWTRCSADCGTGTRSRTRTITEQPSGNGRQCGELEEWEDCNNGPCARDCEMSFWTPWTRCSADCGTGTRSRTRTINSQPSGGGRPCGSLEEWEDCNNGPCARDCEMSFWTPWTRCSADCGTGTRSRTRTINSQPSGGGRPCGSLEEWEDCNNGPCARDCEMSFWTPWTRCSADCGTGTRSRTRTITSQSSAGGRPCGSLEEWEDCSNGPCAQDCVMTTWTRWTRCSADCGTGNRSRTRTIQIPASGNGRQCGGLEEWEDCNKGPCARNCEMASWSSWSRCSADCGDGSRTRARSILTRPSGNGIPCGSLNESEQCNNGECRNCFKECLAECRRQGSGLLGVRGGF